MNEIIIYSADSKRHNLPFLLSEIISELFASRHIIRQIFVRDLKASYRKSYLGYLWAVIPGLTTTLVWFFLNSQYIINVGETPIPYPLYVMIGSTLWLFLTQAIQSPMNSFAAGSGVFMKLKVSPMAFIMAGFGSLMFDLFLKLLLLLPVCFFFGVVPPVESLYLFPVGIFGILICGTAIGILLIPLGSLYNDVQKLVTFALGFLMYLTPVVYPAPTEGLASTLVKFNPATHLLGATRDWISVGSSQYASIFFIIALGGVVVTLGGLVILKLVMPHLVARMGM
jgi:lipopolysaccharide transport system permease protein